MIAIGYDVKKDTSSDKIGSYGMELGKAGCRTAWFVIEWVWEKERKGAMAIQVHGLSTWRQSGDGMKWKAMNAGTWNKHESQWDTRMTAKAS